MIRSPIKCKQCIYWDRYYWPPDSGIGHCRINPPVGEREDIGGIYKREFVGKWPATLSQWGCAAGITHEEGGAA
jgi:hypothetical protein